VTDGLPHLSTDLAPWFHLLTAPAEHAPGAHRAIEVLTPAIGNPPATIPELGSGGGNNAFHMNAHGTLS
jgi:hypothetical protein